MEKSLQQHLENSQQSFSGWKNTEIKVRQQLISNLANNLLEGKQKFAEIITKEMNKPISQSVSEIEKCASMCRYYADAKGVLEIEKIQTENSISEVHFEPMGVILGIMPWNFPFWQVLRFAVPAILAGNVVVLKHASICLGSGNAIQELFLKSGFPENVLTHLEISHEEVEEAIANPIVKAVSLTGSEAAGRKIAEAAGRNLKKCVLELGGSDAFVVLEDADLDKASKDAALARLQNAGQTCVAGKRFVIHEKIYDEFLNKFLAEFSTYHPGNSDDKNIKMGAMAREDLAAELYQQYEKAIQNGAKILKPLEKVGNMAFEPGLIEMNADNPVNQEELFGPLAMIYNAKDDDDALRIANSTPFGLAGAVYTKSKEKAMLFATQMESGSVAINQIFRSDVRMPFGGRKNSGYGVELTLHALKEFVVLKSIIGNV